MKIIEINAVANGSTGQMMAHIAQTARAAQHQVLTLSTTVFSTNGPSPKLPLEGHRYYGCFFSNMLHYIAAQFTDGNGCFSITSTIRLVQMLKREKPDIVHLHNIHEHCICLPVLFRYLKHSKTAVVWTFHDCWAITGHCMHFDYVGCNRWQNGCGSCPQKGYNPRSRVDRSWQMLKRKQRWFSGIDHMVIVSPSEWLATIVHDSMLKEYPIRVIHNGIDLEVFKPVRDEKLRDNISFMILGVASDWGERKGIDVFQKLASDLPESFKIVLVGTNDLVDHQLPERIEKIHRTQNRQELARYYSQADLFVNPTREDTFPTVNLEALACGTPVLTYRTGGSPECIDQTCGSVVNKDDYDSLLREILRIKDERPYCADNCRKQAEKFDMKQRFIEYVDLYEELYQG